MANRIGVEPDPLAGFRVAEAGLLVQEQNQFGPLTQLEADGAANGRSPGKFQELGGEHRTKRR